MKNLVMLNLPAHGRGPLPIDGKDVVTIDGVGIKEVIAVSVVARMGEPTKVTVEFYAEAHGAVEIDGDSFVRERLTS